MKGVTAYQRSISAALGISVAAHLGGFGVWCAIESGWVAELKNLTHWSKPPTTTLAMLNKEMLKKPATPEEEMTRLIFVETDADQEKPDPSKKTPYYSARSSRAANPKPSENEGELPRLEGNEKRLIATADAPLPRPPPRENESAKPKTQGQSARSEPPPQRAEPPEPTEGITKPQPKLKPPQQDFALLENKDLALRPLRVEPPRTPATSSDVASKAEVEAAKAAVQVARVSPRKLPSKLAEQKETAVAHKGRVALDVRGSLFGAYDERLQAEVARRWYAIVEKYEYGERTGTVEISFKLHSDGRIEELAILSNTAGEVLGQYCKKAIDDSAPFEPFPDELKALLAQEYREINFIFYY